MFPLTLFCENNKLFLNQKKHVFKTLTCQFKSSTISLPLETICEANKVPAQCSQRVTKVIYCHSYPKTLALRDLNQVKSSLYYSLHTVSFDWFLLDLEWIFNLEFGLLKLLIFYQKLLWYIRSRLISSTFWVSRPVFRYVWLKLKLCAEKMKILIKHIYIQAQKLKMWKR